jgi:hypothetical protein
MTQENRMPQTEKLTVAVFKQRLDAGDYESRIGALKSFGRSSLTQAEKDKCRSLVEAKFGADGGVPAKKAPAKAVKSSTPASAPKGRKKTSKKTSKKASKKASKKVTGKAGARKADEEGEPGPTQLATLKGADEFNDKVGKLGSLLSLAREGIAVLSTGRDLHPALDIGSGIEEASQTVTFSMKELRGMSEDLARLREKYKGVEVVPLNLTGSVSLPEPAATSEEAA